MLKESILRFTGVTKKGNNMTKQYALGFVFGQGTTRVTTYIDDKPVSNSLPSATGEGSFSEYANTLEGAGENVLNNPYDHLQSGQYVISLEGSSEEYFVGKIAQKQVLDASTGWGDLYRYGSLRALLLMLTGATTVIPYTTDEIFLNVVTCMPIEPYKNAAIRKGMKERLEGTHHCTVNGKPWKFRIKVGKIFMEGVPPALVHNVPDETWGFIDTGKFTTNFYVSHGLQTPIPNLCFSIEKGVGHIEKRISTYCSKKYGRELKSWETTEILYSYAHHLPYRKYATPHGTIDTSDIETWCTKAVESIGNEINEQLAVRWKSDTKGTIAGDFHRVYIVGGGYYYLYKKYVEKIPENKLAHSDDPENDTPRGCAWFAKQQLQLGRIAITA